MEGNLQLQDIHSICKFEVHVVTQHIFHIRLTENRKKQGKKKRKQGQSWKQLETKRKKTKEGWVNQVDTKSTKIPNGISCIYSWNYSQQEIKSQVEEYARHRKEEKEILRMAEEHRQEMERENKQLSARDLARLQDRVRCLLLYLHFFTKWRKSHFMLLPLQNEKITLERKIKLQSKEIEKEEKEKRLEKLRSQVRLRTKRMLKRT